MKKKVLVVLFIVAILLVLTGCACKHEWNEATCTEPKTCSKCGETEGEPLGHEWKDATCTTPKTCTVCGATEGDAIGHTPGDWVAEDSNTIGGKEVQKCTVCGQIIETRNVDRSQKEAVTVLEPTQLVMTSEEFANHLINYLPDDCYITNIEPSGFDIEGGVDVTVYYDDDEHSYKDNIGFVSNSESDIEYLIEYIIPAVDPNVTGDDLQRSIAEAKSLLDSKTDNMVPLYTGVGYVHYTEPTDLGSKKLPAMYWFYFFTLQYALNG